MFEVYKNRRILITGVTGFKGGWLALWLQSIGGIVSGIGLSPDTEPSLFNSTELRNKKSFIIADIRDRKKLETVICSFEPEFIFHLAAQPLVSVSYQNPSDTFDTNVMGLVNLCEIIKSHDFVKYIVFVTSDKCYRNDNLRIAFKEDDPLGASDPYSASKSCAEIIAKSYAKSFFIEKNIISATTRAGNIIGGGDWSKDRLIPDIVKAYFENIPLVIRNPFHVRPWQHVLDALYGYLLTGEMLIHSKKAEFNSWNFGPEEKEEYSVNDILNLFQRETERKINFTVNNSDSFYEADYLKLNSEKARNYLGWKNVWNTETALKKTIIWYSKFYAGTEKVEEICFEQINEYLAELNINKK